MSPRSWAVRGTPSLGLVVGLSAAAFAATRVVENGSLVGARWVQVGSDDYHVDFRDGTCIELYGNCDEGSDFTFS